MVKFRDRSAADLVVLGVTATVAFMLVISAVTILLVELFSPDTDTDGLVEIESEILGVLVGALVGFLGGRGVGRSEAQNGAP